MRMNGICTTEQSSKSWMHSNSPALGKPNKFQLGLSYGRVIVTISDTK